MLARLQHLWLTLILKRLLESFTPGILWVVFHIQRASGVMRNQTNVWTFVDLGGASCWGHGFLHPAEALKFIQLHAGD